MKPALQTFEANVDGRDYMVGDIHGCFYMLEPLLDRIGFDHACDRLFSVGDLIDRGPDSERAGEFLDQPWFHAIRGNHEQMLLAAVAEGGVGSAHQLWMLNGGGWFEQLDPVDRQSLAERMAVLPYAFEIALAEGGRAALVHADVLDNSWPRTRAALVAGSPNAETAQTLVWQRRRARALDACLPAEIAIEDIDLIAFGHTPMAAPIACANTRWIDTGAFAGGRLSVAQLAVEGEVWSIAADLEDLRSGWRRYG